MKLAFLAPRANHLKILGPVWAEAKRRGHEVAVVVTPADAKGAGARAHVEAEVGGPIRSQIGLAEAGFEWAVAVGLRTAPDLRQRTRPTLRWAALDHCGDNLTFLLEGDSTANWDLVTTLSESARAFVEGETGGYFGHDLIPVGYPELDQCGTVVGDRAACRAKWGIASEQFVVVVGTAARPIGLSRLRRWWFGQYRYRAVLQELHQWVTASRALLIAKTRVKHQDPPWLSHYCHRLVGDESFHPFTTLELLRAADLYVGFASAMAIEACAVGVPSVHLHGWPPEAAEWPSGRPFKEEFFIKEGGLWNCPASRTVTCYGKDWQFRLHDTIDTVLMERKFKGADPMRAACARWTGPLDGKASARVLDLMEARC